MKPEPDEVSLTPVTAPFGVDNGGPGRRDRVAVTVDSETGDRIAVAVARAARRSRRC